MSSLKEIPCSFPLQTTSVLIWLVGERKNESCDSMNEYNDNRLFLLLFHHSLRIHVCLTFMFFVGKC